MIHRFRGQSLTVYLTGTRAAEDEVADQVSPLLRAIVCISSLNAVSA